MKLNRNAAKAVMAGRIPSAVVGANKRVYRGRGGDLHGTLHGYAIVTKTGNKVVLRHHGFRTRAVGMAMREFMAVLDIDGTVSFANGKFLVRVNGKEYGGAYSDVIEVKL